MHTDIQSYTHTDIHTYMKKYRHTDLQTDMHTEIQTNKYTDILAWQPQDDECQQGNALTVVVRNKEEKG